MRFAELVYNWKWDDIRTALIRLYPNDQKNIRGFQIWIYARGYPKAGDTVLFFFIKLQLPENIPQFRLVSESYASKGSP